MRILALLFGSLFVLHLIQASPPSAPPPFCAVAEAKARTRTPAQRKSPEAEPMTYERAMELENQRHAKKLRDIRYDYRFHKPLRKYQTQKENEFHARRVEEIKKRYGVSY